MKIVSGILGCFLWMSFFTELSGLPMVWAQEQADADRARTEFFESKIRPVLVKHCYECHSRTSKTIQGGLKLDTRMGIRQGGDSGPAVIPGDVDGSLLVDALRHDGYEMPPSGKLEDPIINDFVQWIRTGAVDPRDGENGPPQGIDFDQASTFWSFQPIRNPPIPETGNPDWASASIDHFVLAGLEQRGLHPVDPARKHELIRRATFDLTGLPPTPREIQEFLADQSPTAFESVVQRLLDSEHYGERWGRHWLDVARYAEDQAHTFAVKPNSNGFRYRDWVIDAFNQDMPFDRFVQLQIAGDLLGPVAEGNYDHLVALGFFGLGAQYYKNSDAARAAADELDDRVDTLSRGFLGLTVSCARCHDHKFDPIPTEDYYSLAGIFRSSRLHNAPLCSDEDIQTYNAGQKNIRGAKATLKAFLEKAAEVAATSRIDQVSRYMEAVWRYRSTRQRPQPPTVAELAQSLELNEFLLNRWISFLDPKRQGRIKELDDWFALDESTLKSDGDEIPDSVRSIAARFQQRVQRGTEIEEGVLIQNLVDAGKPHEPGRPRFVTPLVTKVRPLAGIDLDIRGATQLILMVTDGGNGRSCDHADWIAPRLLGPDRELKLTELKWKKNTGNEGARINRNYQGKPIRVGGKTYPEGIGVHAKSVLVFDLPAGYERFVANGGIDNSGTDQSGCGDQASIQFSVYTEEPKSEPSIPQPDLTAILLGKDGPFAVSNENLESFLEESDRNQLLMLKNAVQEAEKTASPMYPIGHSYAEGKVADMPVFVRGDPARQRDPVPRRFLRILAGEDRRSFTEGSGRKELALAISSADNPLTARVIANRVWQHHFGRGIVATPSNFGKLGERPTHPELLDHLAWELISSGWSIKSLHRLIMLSSTYRLSTEQDDANTEIDADNRFLWRMNRRRLDVEAWRDALLSVSGQLEDTVGGPSTNLADENNVRRTVYGKVSRHELDRLLRLFDFPDANISSEKRTETTVPQQQLFVLNSPFMVRQARAFSKRLHEEEPGNDQARIRRAFQLAFGREPDRDEVVLGTAYLAGESDPDDKLARWDRYAQILLGSNEFTFLD